MSGAICCWWMSNVAFSPLEWRKDNYSRTSGSILGLPGCWGRCLLIFPEALGHAQQPPSIPQNLPANAQLVVSPSPRINLHFVLVSHLPLLFLWLRCRGMDTQTLTDLPPPPLPLAQAAPSWSCREKMGIAKLKMDFRPQLNQELKIGKFSLGN